MAQAQDGRTGVPLILASFEKCEEMATGGISLN